MSPFSPMYRAVRAPRVSLRGSVSITIQLENRRLHAGKLYRLSINGGLVELTPYIDERTKVLMVFQVGAGLLQGKAEMMFPMRGGMGYFQPFRFTGFAPSARQMLEAHISALLRQAVGPNHSLALNAPPNLVDSL
ncbi:MAG TPA: hypothetical protein VF123_10870 [Candidatus Sulfotelmatobacter sp.]